MRVKFPVFALTCTGILLTTYASAQTIISISGQTCVDNQYTDPTGGSYYGTLAECNVQALCSLSTNLSNNFYIYASAYSGLACPTDTVENNAYGGWNQVNTVNASSLAIDIYNGLVMGSSFSQESCNATPLYTYSQNLTVCGQPPPTIDTPPTGGGTTGGEGGPVLCLYGDIDIDPSDDDIELCSGPPAPLQSKLQIPFRHLVSPEFIVSHRLSSPNIAGAENMPSGFSFYGSLSAGKFGSQLVLVSADSKPRELLTSDFRLNCS